MTNTLRFGLALILPGIALVTAPAGAQQGNRYELTGAKVAVYNLVGSVRIERGTGANVVVEVQRSGRDAGRLDVKTGAIDGVPTLRVIFPGDQISSAKLSHGSNTTVSVNDDGTFGHGHGGDRVRITSRDRASRNALEADADLIVRVPDGVRLEAHLAVGDMDAVGVTADLALNTSAGDIDVSNMRGQLEAATASGGITVTSLDGDANLDSASGDIDINGARGKSVRVDVASGSVTARGIRADDVNLESASGSIRVTDTTAPELKASSASGSVRVVLDGTVRNVEVSTASGDAEVTLSSTFGGEVEMETSSGGVDVDFPLNVTRQRRGYIRGTVGSGSARVSISAASGDVRLLKR